MGDVYAKHNEDGEAREQEQRRRGVVVAAPPTDRRNRRLVRLRIAQTLDCRRTIILWVRLSTRGTWRLRVAQMAFRLARASQAVH